MCSKEELREKLRQLEVEREKVLQQLREQAESSENVKLNVENNSESTKFKSPQTLDNISGINKTFTKKSGTTNEGTDYEDFLTALLALKLTIDDEVKDFQLSSNDSHIDGFDDIVLNIVFKDDTTKCYAIQLKHKQKTITKDMLGARTGDFSIQRHLKGYNGIKDTIGENVECVLYTCASYNVPHGSSFLLEEDTVNVAKYSVAEDLLTSSTINSSYKFKMQPSAFAEAEYKDFLAHFTLYPNQKNATEMRHSTCQLFQKSFFCNENSCNEYLTYIKNWSKLQGRKNYLTKKELQLKITRILLRPHLKSSSSPKLKLFQEACGQFGLTIIETDKPGVLNMFNEESVNKKGNEVLFIKIDQSQRDKILNVICWCLQNVTEIKFVLIGENISKEQFLVDTIFQNLQDLKSSSQIFKKIVKNKVSVQGRRPVALENVTTEDVAPEITTVELIQSMTNSFRVGEDKEKLPYPYIEQFLLKDEIKLEDLLETHTVSSLLVISCNNNLEKIGHKISHFLDVCDYIQKLRNNEHPSVSVIIAREQCTEIVFEFICEKNVSKTCHHFSLRSDESLQWKTTRKNKLLQSSYKIIESEMVSAKNRINVISGQSGMGKSVMLRYLKNNLSSDYWILDIHLCDQSLLNIDEKKTAEEILELMLDYQSRKRNYNSLDKKIRKIFLEKKKIVLLYNELNKLSDEKIKAVLETIRAMLDWKFIVWIAANSHIIEKQKHEFPLSLFRIAPLNKQQQEVYIEKRFLDPKLNELQRKTTKEAFTRFLQIRGCNELLQIPLQLKLVTTLFCDDLKKFHGLDDKVLLLNVVQQIINHTFDFYCYDKTDERFNRINLEQIMSEHKINRFQSYQVLALKTILSEEHFKALHLPTPNTIRDKYGIINLCENNNSVVFSSRIFGEYFAARWFTENSRFESLVDYPFYRNIKELLSVMKQNGRCIINR